MNWEERAKWEAIGRFFTTPIPTAQETRMPMPFIWGAKWQRDQLRTDEAVERVARALLHSDWPADQEDRDYHWKHFADSYRENARAAITALLGEDT